MISIIIPIYNADMYLNKCIDSIRKQTFSDYELLLIDDGSMDSSGKICDEYALVDKRIKVYHKQNGGSASARNLGLQKACGEYIAFVDADDIIGENYLQILYRATVDNEADIAQCAYKQINNYAQIVSEGVSEIYKVKNIYTNIEFLKAFCQKRTYLSVAVLWNKLYRRALFANLEFIEGKGIDDEFLIYKLIYNAKKIVEIDNVLYYYFLSAGSQMRAKAPTLKRLDNIEAIEGQLDFFKQISHMELYNMLLYRYYSTLIDGYFYVKKNFKGNNELLLNLKYKKNNYKEALKVSEVSLFDKVLLIFHRFFPRLFHLIKGV